MSAADYHWGDLLGQGSFGDVWEAVDKRSGARVAVKVLDNRKMKSKKSRERLNNELKILSKVKHPNIITLITSFEEEDKVFLVTELCKRGELLNVVKNKKYFSEDEAREYFGQLVDGVKYLHSHTIIHRDLKLANLLLTEDQVLKIADFGLATQLDHPDSVKHTVCGTPNYLSPEIANREPYSLTTDLWSLGVVLYTMLCGTPPFQEDKIAQTIARVKTASFTCPNHFSTEAKDLVTGLLHKDGSKRIKISEIKQHPFFTGVKEDPSPRDKKESQQPQAAPSPLHSHKGGAQQGIASPAQPPFRPSNAGNYEGFNPEQDNNGDLVAKKRNHQEPSNLGSQPQTSSVQKYPTIDENQDPTVEIDVRVGFRGSHIPPGHHRLEINAPENEVYPQPGNSHCKASPVTMSHIPCSQSRQELGSPNQQAARNQEVHPVFVEHEKQDGYKFPSNLSTAECRLQGWDGNSQGDQSTVCRSHDFASATAGYNLKSGSNCKGNHAEPSRYTPNSNMARRSFSQFETKWGSQALHQGWHEECTEERSFLPPTRRKQANIERGRIEDAAKAEIDPATSMANNVGSKNGGVCANSNQEMNYPPQIIQGASFYQREPPQDAPLGSLHKAPFHRRPETHQQFPVPTNQHGPFAPEQSMRIQQEYAGNVGKVPDNPPINSDRDSHSSTSSSGVHGHSHYNASQLALVKRPISSDIGQGSRLGYRQNENEQIQFWFVGQHYSGTKAEEMRASLEQLGAAGHVEALGAAGPCADHVPYQDMDMRICAAEDSFHKIPSTARLPSVSRRTPKAFKLRATVHILPDKSICVTTASNPGVAETRYIIGSDGVEVRMERRPLPGSKDLEPILSYKFPHIPMCVMVAYQVARDLVIELADRVVQVKYAAFCGMGCMYESGSVILEMDESHRQELQIETVGLIVRCNDHHLYLNSSQHDHNEVFPMEVCTVEGGRQVYSISEGVATNMSSAQLRAAELVLMLKANCEKISSDAITAESNGHLVQWPISGEDKLVVG